MEMEMLSKLRKVLENGAQKISKLLSDSTVSSFLTKK